MPSRIGNGSTVNPESIQALIRSRPSSLESGLRLLEFDIRTGPGTTLDAIGVDGAGGLAMVAVAAEGPEPALVRLLDGHVWAADQRDLLERLYAGRGLRVDRPSRGFLLASSFTHSFLRRLSLLSVSITPCLAREIERGEEPRLTIVEPARPIFGLDGGEPSSPVVASKESRQPFWPEGVLPTETHVSRGSPSVPVLDESMPWPDTMDDRFPWDTEEALPIGSADDRGGPRSLAQEPLPPGVAPPADDPVPGGTFETLTIEELEEFERFERQRLERGGSST